MAHLESTVHWMNNVQTLWNDYGIRLFVEVGPGDILSNLIADTLPEPLCLQTCLPTAESHTYQTALAQLFVHGHLQVRGEPRFVSLPASRKAPASHRHAPAGERSSRPLDRPPATPDGQAAPALAEAPERQDHLEAIIRIIMDATGFNRDEIQPDMDLRRDLSVRSSRLPIIMDAAERHFGITIELEDFIHVRTVRDIAQRISAIVARQEGAGERPAAKAADPGAAPAGIPEPSADEARLKRLVFNLAPVEPAASMPVELSPGEAVLLLSPDQDDALAKSAGDLLRQDYGVDTFPLPFMPEHLGPGEEGHDILTAAGVTRTSEKNLGPRLPRGAGHHLASRRVGTVGRHGGCFAAAHGALSTPEGLSPITNQEIRRPDSCPRGYRHSWSAADGGAARTVSERRPGIPRGPVSHAGNRPGHRPAPGPARRSGQGLRRGGAHSSRRQGLHLAGDTWPPRSSAIRQV